MKSIMEECKIVENFTILLYSRTYQTLYLQIFHSENKNLLSKHVIKTSDQVTIELGMPLNEVQMMVKKSEQSLQILSEFKFRFEDFSTNSTVQQMDHYVKLKKRFPQYSLLFQIFYRLRSSVNSSNNIGEQEERQANRVSEEEKKKQHQNELKDITKSNLILLGFKVVNSLFRKQTRNKTSLPSDKSLNHNSIRRNKKNKTTFVVDNNYHVKKSQILRSNVGKYTQVNTSRKQSKQVSVQDQCEKFKDFKDHFESKDIQESQFVMRKNKKNLTISAQKSGFVMKRSSQKKITFDQQTSSLTNRCQINPNKFNMVKYSSTKNKKTIQQEIKEINDLQKKEIYYPKNFDHTLEYSRITDIKQDFQNTSKQALIFSQSIQKVKNNDLVIRKLKKLCQQRPTQKMLNKKLPPSKLKFHLTQPSLTKSFQSKNQNTFDSNPYLFNTLKNIKKRNFMTKKFYGSRQCFYENLYEKTIESIDRQSQIINFVKNQCRPFQFLPINNQSISQIKLRQTFQDLKGTNASTQTNETIPKPKENKLKKVKSQDQFLAKFKIYLKANKKLRS